MVNRMRNSPNSQGSGSGLGRLPQPKVIFAAVILSKHHVDSLAIAQELHDRGCYAVVLAGSLSDVQLLVIILNCHHTSSLIVIMYVQIVTKPHDTRSS